MCVKCIHALPRLFISLLLIIGSDQSAYTQERVGLDLSCGSTFSVSECPQNGQNPMLAGGMGRLNIGVDIPLPRDYKPSEYHGISWDWPQGLTIEVGIITESGWTVLPGLAARMNFQRWNSGMAIWEDSVWQATGREMSSFAIDTSWHFTFIIPEDLVGQQIFFKATYVHDTLGTLINRIPEDTTFVRNHLTIVEPCSQKDRDRILGSFVQYAFLGGDYARALSMTDSLIPLGWRDLAGLGAASIAARDLGQLQRSLNYLDLNYSANSRTNFLTPLASPEREAEKYQSIRQDILRKIEQQH